MAKTPDIVHAFLDLFAKYAPPAEVARFEIEMREQWGGCNVYVRKPEGCPEIRADPDSTRAKARPRRQWE